MKLIKSNFEILYQSEGLQGVYKQIEIASRTCYKSESKITENSAEEFVNRMIKNKHYAMLEHGTVYLEINNYEDTDELFYKQNPYSKAVAVFPNLLYVTTNLRVIIENNRQDDLKWLCKPTKWHEQRVTVKFTCDRGVSHEFVRHRTFSFAQESTRYCNYTKDKFDNNITYIIPSNLDIPEGKYTYTDGDWWDIERSEILVPNKNRENPVVDAFLQILEYDEGIYNTLIDKEWKPQQARQVLPNALKTELVMTGFITDWEHFFYLRTAPTAHPDAQRLATPLMHKFIKLGYIGKIDE